MDAPMPKPVDPPAIVRRWCDANGCYVVRGYVNPPAVVPKEAPMPMPSSFKGTAIATVPVAPRVAGFFRGLADRLFVWRR